MGRIVIGLLLTISIFAAGCRIPSTEQTLAREAADRGEQYIALEDRDLSAPGSGASSTPEGDSDSTAAGDPESSEVADSNKPISTEGLPYSGPGLNSHWHAAYAVRICDEVLDPFTSQDDPLGIHSHGDGLIHIHPFFSESGWENATFGVFADAMGVVIEDGYLAIPGVGEWRDGDECDGVPSRLTIKRWARPTSTEPYEVLTSGLADARFVVDGELFTVSFAPEGHLPIRPSAVNELLAASSSLQQGPPDPYVSIPDPPAPGSAALWIIGGITEAPCEAGTISGQDLDSPEFCYTRGTSPIERDEISQAQAMWINNGPGVVLDLRPSMVQQLNSIISPHVDTGGVRLAVELGGEVVVTVALLRPLGDNRLAFVGGLTTEQAITLADAFGGV